MVLVHLLGKCLFLSGFTEKLLNHMDDESLPEKYGIGFTNMVERATPGSKDLSRCGRFSLYCHSFTGSSDVPL